ncbi:MAG: phosphoribosylformylglycinamidine synthase, partial [Candidatus Sericytochromatia bacterium]|nr:phosphoribosylformylglycinamidine synthase [Candidatus Sericytochromatia bacterium]
MQAGALADSDANAVGGLLSDPVAERVFVDRPPGVACDWCVEVAYKPGVTDNAGQTASLTLDRAADAGFLPTIGPFAVRTARRYYISGPLRETDIQRVADQLLANALVQQLTITAGSASLPAPGDTPLPAESPVVTPWVEVPLPDDDAALLALSRTGVLALNLAEMRVIRDHFAQTDRQDARRTIGLPAWPTDVELEALAQTWSEHCKHKIFNAKIHYREGAEETVIDGLFPTYIKGSTRAIAAERDWLVSVFDDNAGVIRWSDDYHAVFKVETHNAPSALDPYGGALTGIVGVNRDPAATGLGAKLVFNTDVFCLARPSWSAPLP